MVKNLLKLLIASTMVFSLILVKNTNAYTADSSLEVAGVFTKPSDIHTEISLIKLNRD